MSRTYTYIKAFLFFASLISYCLALQEVLFSSKGEVLGISFQKTGFTFFESIRLLESEGYTLMSKALFVFVVILPGIKFLVLLCNLCGVVFIHSSINKLLLSLQKYAMVDVFVISLFLLASKSNPLFSIQIETGTYLLLISVLLSMVLSIVVSYSQNAKLKGKLN